MSTNNSVASAARLAERTLRAKHGPRGKLIAAHFSFFILNMATMPPCMIEGDILYGIICGYTLYLYFGPATVPVATTSAAIRRPLRPY